MSTMNCPAEDSKDEAGTMKDDGPGTMGDGGWTRNEGRGKKD